METVDLRDELKRTKKLLNKKQKEVERLKKAVWDMLNYANVFIVIFDKNMIVKLANYYLATELGFKDEHEIIGKCWLDFIIDEQKELVKNIYSASNFKDYEESIYEIIGLNKKSMIIKWFNTRINTTFNLIICFGMQKGIVNEVTEESIRSYYRDIIDKDKTMIKSLRDTIVNKYTLQPLS